MDILNSQRPSGLLRPFVRAYAQRVVHEDAAAQLIPPRLEPTLEFNFGTPLEVWLDAGAPLHAPRAVIVGSYANVGIHLRLTKGVESFAVFFRPGAISQLFGIPSRHLTNAHADAQAVLGRSLSGLWEEMASASTFPARVSIVERFLALRVEKASTTLIANAANELFRRRGTPRIAPLAVSHGLDIRQFERRFTYEIGLSPKLFARIARFQTAIDWKLAHPETTWRHIAHALGYHDQMHLIHDCKKLGGSVPGQIIGMLGDSRPPALSGDAG